MLTCKNCEESKDESEFYPSSKTRCKACWKIHFAELKAKKEGKSGGEKAV